MVMERYHYEWVILVLECRGQDSNLRTHRDWDLIPAPLTKLGNPCFNRSSRRAYINDATNLFAELKSLNLR